MIAIKDFKMPVDCSVCFGRGAIWCRFDESDRIVVPALPEESLEGRPEWCPLVEVPDMNIGKCSEFPNSSDCVSRQAVFDALNKLDVSDGVGISSVACDLQEEAIRSIENLPSVELKRDREFMKLTVRNSNGRPYYSIIYLEFDDNDIGKDFEGYSSYSLDVISDYLKKYFMPSVQPEIIRCKECVYSHMTYDGDCKYCDKWGEIYESGELLYLEGDFFCGFGEKKTDD